MAQLHPDLADGSELGEGFRVLPPGEYQVYMESSEFKKTKKGDGEFLECVLIVGNGEYEGAKVFVRLNLINPNQTAVDIAKSQLRALCEAIVGQPFVNDSAMLHSRPFFVLIDNVPMNKDDPNSKRSNEVVFRKGTIRSLNSGPASTGNVVHQTASVKEQEAKALAGARAMAASVPVQQVQAGVGKPPWKK